ncbi:hypothetical protein K6119_04115 [Paracrocinitomix mangrovi]|uniref:hypothetical protein n=1 Tax=Paracrocinitomix mangrovi TaxID=2862509 RepID=UPI001C8EC379|nr:hypothetical protein [Paracrocinitomix mangrovi]UKN02698.1 hypothetical protein K6119_04115 [Paracrocinitomix mangrovi]
MKNKFYPKVILAASLLSLMQIACNGNESATVAINNVDRVNVDSCDEDFIQAIELIKSDSPFLFVEPLLNVFHKKLDTNRIWKNKGLDSIFTDNDLYYLHEKEWNINTACYPMFEFTSIDSAKSRIDQFLNDNNYHGNTTYYSVSKPIKSLDGNYLLIEMDKHCYGLCGMGETFLFQKTHEGWKKVWEVFRWIS